MKLLTDWGFTRKSFRGQRGEYWVLVQAILMIGFLLMPVYRPIALRPLLQDLWPVLRILAIAPGILGLVLGLKGLFDLGRNLTPLPYPREDGQLVRSGVYGWVRHPLYGGLLLTALAWSLLQASLTHGLLTGIGLVFFNAKADREESWLMDRYEDYGAYRQQVKKLIPWIY